uniref:Uncharacterized protein n=1 Tax=Pyricularia oryzae (strain P131) TaxID=1143193 RepID=L7IQL7_PYRO1
MVVRHGVPAMGVRTNLRLYCVT